MKYKTIKLTSVLIGFGLTGLSAQSMYLKQINGTQIEYTLCDVRKISFTSGTISINKNYGSIDNYMLSDLSCMDFQDFATNITTVSYEEGKTLLYPNPVTDVLAFRMPIGGGQIYTIDVLTIDGKLLFQTKTITDDNTCEVNVSILPRGIYLCKIYRGAYIQVTKFLKQ